MAYKDSLELGYADENNNTHSVALGYLPEDDTEERIIVLKEKIKYKTLCMRREKTLMKLTSSELMLIYDALESYLFERDKNGNISKKVCEIYTALD